MSKITEIENAIIQMGDGEFQKFCDTFLSKKAQYGLIHGFGMKAGTTKTTKGNPDTYFRSNDGKYIFVVYTTQQASIYSKIQEDIEKCFDPSKTGVQCADIAEIVCCHTSSNLSAGDDKKLHELCNLKDIKLTIYGVDEIAQQVYRDYPSLARDFFGISIDTNQIVDVADFVHLYDSSKTAAPLDTVFQNREELEILKQRIRENEVVIVHGPAGVGKTRIVIEAIKNVASADGYRLLCIKNNNLPIFDDLVSYTNRPGADRYLFFIDDANEFTELNLILDYFKKDTSKFKIVLTVRDYAKEGVKRAVLKNVQPSLLEIKPVSDEAIRKFLDVNLDIRNEQFVDAIVQIAEGNLRIAYMAGQIAIESNSLDAVHDATQVYEQYYASVVDQGVGNDTELCLTAGVLSLVKAVMLDKLDYLNEILKIADINTERFRSNIDRLFRMEVVEIHMDQVAAISDQCLSNYMLYYVFFLRKMIPFSVVLTNGFLYFRNGVIQSVNTLLNIFSKREVRDYMKEEVIKTWNHFRDNNTAYYEEFARVFHMFWPEEAFVIAKEKIDKIEQQALNGKRIDFKRNAFRNEDEVLGFLTGYHMTIHFNTAMDLFMEYANKSEENSVTGLNWLKNYYGFDLRENRADYYDEIIITKKMLEGLRESEVIQQIALEYVKEALAFEFHSSELGHDNSIRMYTMQIVNSEGVKEYRKNCWKIIVELIKLDVLNEEVYSLIDSYSKSVRAAEDKSILMDDKPFIEEIVVLLKKNPIRSAIMTREIQRAFQKREIVFSASSKYFELPEWKLYERLDDKWIYSELTYEEYQEKRDSNINEYAESLSKEDVGNFLIMSKSLINSLGEEKKYSITEGINRIIRFLCQDCNKATIIYRFVLSEEWAGCDIEAPIQVMFRCMTINQLWEDVSSIDDPIRRNKWQFEYFKLIPEEFVTDNVYQQLLCFLRDDSDKDICRSGYRNMRFLDKFLKVDGDAYVNASRIILDKRNCNGFMTEMYLTLLFNEHVYSPKEIIELYSHNMSLLKDVFFYMLDMVGMTDVKGSFLIELLEADESWIDEYADIVCRSIKKSRENNHRYYQLIWKSDRYMSFFDKIYIRICEECNEFYYEWRLEDVFGEILSHGQEDDELIKRQEMWVMHTIEMYKDSPQIILLFRALASREVSLKKHAFQKFLSLNDDYELFEKLPLDTDHWGGMVEEIIPDLQRRISFLESLMEDVQGIRFIQHAKRIRNRIDMWKSRIKAEEREEIYRKLYR